MSHLEHKANIPKVVNFYVVTVSNTRTEDTDISGKLIIELLKNNDHSILGYKVCKDNFEQIKELILQLSNISDLDAIILNGGTGINPEDLTIEAVKSLIEKEITGFGELFRYLSFIEIGTSAMLSRACAGVYKNKVIFSIPGSINAVSLAVNKLILPEIGHIIREIKNIK